MAAATSRGSTSRASYAVLERNAPQAIRGYRTEAELRYLVGTGVSAAAIWRMRERARRGRLPEGQDRRLLRLQARPSAA